MTRRPAVAGLTDDTGHVLDDEESLLIIETITVIEHDVEEEEGDREAQPSEGDAEGPGE